MASNICRYSIVSLYFAPMSAKANPSLDQSQRSWLERASSLQKAHNRVSQFCFLKETSWLRVRQKEDGGGKKGKKREFNQRQFVRRVSTAASLLLAWNFFNVFSLLSTLLSRIRRSRSSTPHANYAAVTVTRIPFAVLALRPLFPLSEFRRNWIETKTYYRADTYIPSTVTFENYNIYNSIERVAPPLSYGGKHDSSNEILFKYLSLIVEDGRLTHCVRFRGLPPPFLSALNKNIYHAFFNSHL